MSGRPLGSRLTPIAAYLVAALALNTWTSTVCASTQQVTNCADDNSAGSLRKAVKAATSGDVIDMTTLPCSLITLKLGAIPVPLNNLTLQGPSPPHAPLTISGADNYRVLDHSTLFNMGTLYIDDLTIASGKYLGSGGQVHGGCIYSNSNVQLTNSTVTLCTAKQQSGGFNGVGARGGGIYAVGLVTLTNSVVSGNQAYSQETGYSALGGGIVAKGVFAYYSTVTGNRAHAGQNATSMGGGIATGYGVITASTIDSNFADFAAGVDLFGSKQMTITNSTISANTATSGASGIGMYFQTPLALTNSTIAFNRSSTGAGGLSVAVSNSLVMHSTIIAENATGSGSAADLHVVNSTNVSGAHNLVMHADAFLPSGFVAFSANPKLAPLGNHGGPTLTNALSTGSPAIDQGDNTAGLFDDQRGLGYSRTVGFGFVPDIGAYERQDNDDEIFADGFGF